jgi:hypothetical protein
VLLAADGFCYFAAPDLRRSAWSGCGEQLVHAATVAPKRAWLSASYVWWTLPSDAGLAIWRVGRNAQPPAPELFALVAADQDWEAGTDSQLFRRVRGSRACSIVSAPVDDLAQESVTRMTYSWSCSGDLLADDQSLFFNQYSGSSYQLYRIDFADPSQQIYTGLSSTDYAPVRYVLNGAWVYAQRVGDPVGIRYPVTLFRKPKRSEAAPEQLFAAEPGLVNFRSTLFAVLGDSLVFASYREPRLVVKAIAPHPCSPELPCPPGAGSCAADLFCR